MSKIYMVELIDRDRNDSFGYFDTYEKAKECCDYLNKARRSDCNWGWEIASYSLDPTDYAALLKAYEEEQKRKYEQWAEGVRQHELAELARLKAKYEGV